jgi:hypothetical protein
VNGLEQLLLLIAVLVVVLVLMRLRHRRPSRRQRVLEVFLRYPTTRWYVTDLNRVARLSAGSIYPELASLERDAWVRSGLEDPVTTPYSPRRVYWLNPDRSAREYDPEALP